VRHIEDGGCPRKDRHHEERPEYEVGLAHYCCTF
jgi:hypothetical protein